MTTVRPGLILQPDAAAEIGRYFIGRLLPTSLLRPSVLRFAPWPKAIAIQIVHADDVADALVRILHRRPPGPLDLAAEPVLDRSTLRDVFGGLGPSVPLPLARAAVAASWQLHLQPTDTGWIDLAQSVPILDSGRAKRDLDWTPFHRADELLGDGILDGLAIGHFGLVAGGFVDFGWHPCLLSGWGAQNGWLCPGQQGGAMDGRIPLTGLRRARIKRATVPLTGIKREHGAGASAPIRGCPRNCSRRANGQNTTGKPGRWPAVRSREPGDLPSSMLHSGCRRGSQGG